MYVFKYEQLLIWRVVSHARNSLDLEFDFLIDKYATGNDGGKSQRVRE